MSYYICLLDENEEVIKLDKPRVMRMGTMQMDGETEAHINITYNYGQIFRDTIDKDQGIRWLYGKKAKDTIDALITAMTRLKNDFSEDYWEATEGNAKLALVNLLELAWMYPEGVWEGD